MRRVPWLPTTLILLILVLGGVYAVALRQGLVPSQYNPLAPIDLKDPSGWFRDWRIQHLARNPGLCAQSLSGPLVDAKPVKDKDGPNGCGWHNSVSLSSAGGAKLSPFVISCPVAAALSMWMAHEVQPLAERLLGSRVVQLEHAGGYSCRNMVSHRTFMTAFKSQHANANAVDIMAFQLADGRRIAVKGGWKGPDAQGLFLKAVHASACGYFRVVLGPDFNALHHDHFHLDRGTWLRCK